MTDGPAGAFCVGVAGHLGRHIEASIDELRWGWRGRDRDKEMTTTMYYATTAGDQLAKAQWILDTHITSSATGRCLACGAFGPCWRRETAVSIFSHTLRLPRRMPGATRPELVGARLLSTGGPG